ncbi:hypothetical protein [Streptomyces niveus]|uniref:hypothetical protein n=1 Tax=Streptomyces niveus TaxID=193462 RepID=UPI0036A443EE
MTEYDFPQDLRDAQLRLHQASAAYRALCRTLPSSVEPVPGWAGEKQPYTDYKIGKPDSPDSIEHEKIEMVRLRADVMGLSIKVSTHPYWATLEPGTVVEGRMALKQTPPSSAGRAATAPGDSAQGPTAARAA